MKPSKMNSAIAISGTLGFLVGVIYLRQRKINELISLLDFTREKMEIAEEFLSQIADQLDQPVVISKELATRMQFFNIAMDNDLF